EFRVHRITGASIMTVAASPATSPSRTPAAKLNALTREQVESYHEHGFLHIPAMFTQPETDELSEHLNWLIDEWAMRDAGWTGPWRKKYMDAETEKKSKLIALHDLQYYSDAWARAVTNRKLAPS